MAYSFSKLLIQNILQEEAENAKCIFYQILEEK